MTKSEKMCNFIPYINTGWKMKRCIIIILAMLFVSGLHAQEAKTVISAEDLSNRSVTDAGAALQGKAAGLLVMNMSGAPGETARLRLRGFTTDTGNGGPLLIVDGLKVENIQHLDPSMIEKIEILKDAAATALYGIQGGNGVIRITTKNGSARSVWHMISSLQAHSRA